MEDRNTLIEVRYPRARGQLGLRGSGGPLSWDETMLPTRVEGDVCLFELRLDADDLVELKLVRDHDDWAAGRNFVVHAGDHFTIEPCFDRSTSVVMPMEPLAHPELPEPVAFDVLLPPSYEEQENKRYPVLYVLDGQSLWSFSTDPFGVWNLELTLDRLFELGATEEIIVVALRTDRDRLGLLSPMPDPNHGGGQGAAFLRAIVDVVKPVVDERFRTYVDRENTGILGSSMGGLFAFYAAWTRPDVFGKSACLSSSFWWSQRGMIKLVQSGACPYPRPRYYIDSGASFDPAEQNPNVRDGFHHTRSMVRAMLRHCYQAGTDLHRFTFTGDTHDAPSWAARVGIPMQILFPKAPPGEITEARD
jgi:hypothetical protein